MFKFRRILVSCALACGLVSAATAESFGGIGVTITPSQSGVQVVDVIPGSPAARSGLQANDQIVSVNGQSLAGHTIDEARNMLRGKVGTTVEVGVLRGIAQVTATMDRAALEIADLSTQSVESWYGTASDLSGEELSYLAAKESREGTAFLGILQNGRVVGSDANVQAEALQGVYMVLPEQEKQVAPLAQSSGAILRRFSRTSVDFELPSAGAATLTLLNSQGQAVKTLRIEQGNLGANTLEWDGSALASGRYTLRISHQGSNSGYSVQLR